MKANVSKIFNRTKLTNNRLFQNKIINKTPDSLLIPQMLNKLALDCLTDNIGFMKKTFDKDVAFFGRDSFYFLENAPANFIPKRMFLCDIVPQCLETQLRQINSSPIIQQRYSGIRTCNLNDSDGEEGSLTIYPICCEEELWPFREDSLQLIVSNLNLHWVNDLNVSLQRALNSLQPDGVLVGSMLGADTLQELRISYTLSENERYGGVSQHVSPFASITEIGNLITRLRFTLPTVFSERKKLDFEGVLQLLQYLQEVGESDALLQTRSGLYRETLEAMITIYTNMFSDEETVYATFEFINFAGWKFHEGQQTSKARGTAEFSLKTLSSEIEKEGGVIVEEGELLEEDIIEDGLTKL